MPTISVIVPVYKVEAYLHRCIDSVLKQSYQDIELILVDDGSPDNCGAICDDYARRDSRIRVIHKQNGGVSSARNAGLAWITGEYVTFCDSDDSYEPTWLAALISAANQYDADIVVGNFLLEYESGLVDSPAGHKAGVFHTALPEEKLAYCIRKVFGREHGWEVWSRLFRTSIIHDHGIRFCETCGNFAEDLGFVTNYAFYANRIVSVSEAGYRYLIRGGSMMQSSAGLAKLNAVNEVSLYVIKALQKAFDQKDAERMAPIFHFLIMDNQYEQLINIAGYRHAQEAFDQIVNFPEWKYYTQQIFRFKKTLFEKAGTAKACRALYCSYHCLHKHWFWFTVGNALYVGMLELRWRVREKLEQFM